MNNKILMQKLQGNFNSSLNLGHTDTITLKNGSIFFIQVIY